MKRFVISSMSVLLFFSFHLGSVFAKSPLDETVDKLLGIRYQWGGDTTAGFDCSGFTKYVFHQFGIQLPHSSSAQSKVGNRVSKENLRAGDLVFFNTNGKGISHVGIYLGDQMFIHASSNKGVIKSNLNEPYYAKRYVTAARILSDEAYVKLTTEPVPAVTSTETKATQVVASNANSSEPNHPTESPYREMKISKVR